MVRFLARDDARQRALADHFFIRQLTATRPGFISLVVLLETVWVLSTSYNYGKSLIVEVVEKILNANELIVEDANGVELALELYRETKIDFADALIVAHNRNQGCETTITFDKTLAKTGFAEELRGA
jgi:predicted nucleic-acid-binding protein